MNTLIWLVILAGLALPIVAIIALVMAIGARGHWGQVSPFSVTRFEPRVCGGGGTVQLFQSPPSGQEG